MNEFDKKAEIYDRLFKLCYAVVQAHKTDSFEDFLALRDIVKVDGLEAFRDLESLVNDLISAENPHEQAREAA